MRKSGYYFTLVLYPIGFFALLGIVEYMILQRSYDAQHDRTLQPYVDGEPIPVVEVRADRRPTSIAIPSVDTPSGVEVTTPKPSDTSLSIISNDGEYAAIAYNPKTGAATIAQQQSNEVLAQRNAVMSCGRFCVVAVSADTAFIAFAEGKKSTLDGLEWVFTWAQDPDRDHAAEVAVRQCRLQYGRDCETKIVGGGPVPKADPSPSP